jgi:glycosyltransferase involved in cell wall biosynthesis
MNRKIKICHISESSSGGVLTHLTQLAENLNSEKFEQSFVLSSKKNNELTGDFLGHPLMIIDMEREIRPLEDIVSIYRIVKLLRSNNFDIIHCHSSKAGVLGRAAAFLTGHTKVVYTPHAFSFNSSHSSLKNVFYIFIEKFMSFLTSKIICVSTGEHELALKSNVSSSSKLIMIPNGIDNCVFQPNISKFSWLKSHGLSGEEKVVGFLGRLAEQKNPFVLLRAIEHITQNDYVVIYIGGGPLEGVLRSKVSEMGLENKVIVLGERKNAREYLAYCDILVCPSLWEGLPYSLLESLVQGVPIVASDIPGIRELVIDKYSGLLFQPNDHVQLAYLIDQLLGYQDLRIGLTANGFELVTEKYGVEKMIASLETVYSKVISG